jgi:hypothetical protein
MLEPKTNLTGLAINRGSRVLCHQRSCRDLSAGHPHHQRNHRLRNFAVPQIRLIAEQRTSGPGREFPRPTRVAM